MTQLSSKKVNEIFCLMFEFVDVLSLEWLEEMLGNVGGRAERRQKELNEC